MATILTICRQVARLLDETNLKVVFAESCTAGLASASLARIPGISERHCGSAVTYRSATKTAWLNVSRRTLDRVGAVSEQAARQMAEGVLAVTPEADISASVTGHLGPGAPVEQDGLIFVAVARRTKRSRRPQTAFVQHVRLASKRRYDRQREAAAAVLTLLSEELQKYAK